MQNSTLAQLAPPLFHKTSRYKFCRQKFCLPYNKARSNLLFFVYFSFLCVPYILIGSKSGRTECAQLNEPFCQFIYSHTQTPIKAGNVCVQSTHKRLLLILSPPPSLPYIRNICMTRARLCIACLPA